MIFLNKQGIISFQLSESDGAGPSPSSAHRRRSYSESEVSIDRTFLMTVTKNISYVIY